MNIRGRTGLLILSAITPLVVISAAYGETKSQSQNSRLPELDWATRSDWINVQTAGAKGDGITDDTEAIQQVLNDMSDKRSSGRPKQLVVYFPPGKYRITRTLTITESTGGWLVGHGRTTTILWDGEVGGRMYWSNGCRYVCYEGLTWDGQGKAAILIEHQSQSYYETWIRYLHCAFLNARDHGVTVGHGKAKNESAELWFYNCLFDNCGEGVSLLNFNDYDNIFDGCEFTRCGIGVHAIRGNWQIRGSRFLGSRISDVKQVDISHGSSLRFCVSKGSRRFLETCNNSNAMSMQIQGCRIEGWTAPDGAISIGHPGPITMFDCVFANPPNSGPPVALTKSHDIPQSLIVSENAVQGGATLFLAGKHTSVVAIPAGQRKPVVPPSGQCFFSNRARIPGKVFDAKVDFGAKGDGKTDDTDAVQKCIDAARQHGKDAIAYLPGGNYCISQTLKVAGGHYFLGGMGVATTLLWKGDANGVAMHVDNPQNIVIENFRFEEGNDTYTRIRQTADGPSSILYDQFTANQYNHPPDGILCENLPEKTKVRFGLFKGKLRLNDCSQADIFALIHYGDAILDGAKRPKIGFAGFMFRNGFLYVRDNQDVVVGDCYLEQTDHYLLCEGGERKGTGHITIGASKISTKDAEPVTIRNYEGRVWISGGGFQWEKDPQKPVHLKQEGPRPVWLISAGNALQEPILEFSKGGNFVRLSNIAMKKPLPNQGPANALREAAGALDDFRQLGAVYLETYSERE